MKKSLLSMLMIGILGATALSGCTPAPEASESGGVYHAMSAEDSKREDIVAGETDTEVTIEGEKYDALIGTEENGIRICADIPTVSANVPVLTLEPRDDFDEEKLKQFLGSDNAQDVTAEVLAEIEEQQRGLSEEEKVPDLPHFGDDSYLELRDGKKTASFIDNTGAHYEDEELHEKCSEIYKVAEEIDITKDGEYASAAFSLDEAEEILKEKMEILGDTEIAANQIYYYELGDTAFYEINFSPVYEGIAVANGIGTGWVSGDVIPQGTAWITKDGIAVLFLGVNGGYYGKITDKSDEKIMTFEKVTELLEMYLENGTMVGNSELVLPDVRLEYYPGLYDSKLVLTPAWHIYFPQMEMMSLTGQEGEIVDKTYEMDAVSDIYLDAATGEIFKAD